MGQDAMILVFWMLSFKPTFSLSSFTFIKKLFSSSLLSAIRVVSSAYLRLLIFLLAILIPAYASSRPAFHMYSAYKLIWQDDNIQPCHTPFPIWNQSVVPCQVLTVASWPAYRFLRRQIRWSGIPISLGIFQFVVIHTRIYDWTELKEKQRCRWQNKDKFSKIFWPEEGHSSGWGWGPLGKSTHGLAAEREAYEVSASPGLTHY